MSSPQPEASRTLSDEAIELAAHRISEKVTDKLFRNISIALTLIGAFTGLAIFFGLSAFKSSIARDVEDKVQAQIERETRLLSDRVRNDLVEVEISSRTVKKTSETAEAQLSAANAALSKIQEVSARSNKLSEEFNGLNRRFTVASNQALQDISNLRRAQLNAAAGRPSIVSWMFDPKVGAKKSVIEGSNFGDSPGNIRVRVAYRQPLTADASYLSPLAFTAWILIDRESIEKWSGTMIVLSFSDSFHAKYKAAVEQLHVGNPDAANAPPEIHEYRIETRAGSFNEAY